MSASAREALQLDGQGPLDPWAYAAHLGVVILEFVALEITDGCREQLLDRDPDSWSGMTIREGGTTAILLNPAHGQARQRSTLMHELAHILLRHTPNSVQVSSTGMLLLSDYSAEQEDEADWLAAAMLLPRNSLVIHRARGRSSADIAAHFGVSEPLTEWRLRMTGVDLQLRRAGRR